MSLSWSALLGFLVLFTNLSFTFSLPVNSSVLSEPSEFELDPIIRHRLNKAHGILMVFSWLFFLPTAFLFARFFRSSWSNCKPGGLFVWFHVHRTCNMIGVTLMVTSFICILISKGWKWTGPGSDSSYWTKVHTVTGLIALILAWLQPIISLIRCGPSDARRPIFNWSHRLIGLVAISLATTAFVVAAQQFKKLWTNHAEQTALVMFPVLLLAVLVLIFSFLDKNKEKADEKNVMDSIRQPVIFFCIGLLLANTVALTVMIANGYKAK